MAETQGSVDFSLVVPILLAGKAARWEKLLA